MIETRFKDTEVGRIPEDWTLIPIRELAKDMADGPFGSNLKTEHYTIDKQVRIIQLGNIGDCGWLDDNTKYTTYEHAKTLSRCIATPGSILVAKMMPAGRSVVCPSEEKQYILGSDVVRIVPNEKLIAEYFVYQSKSDIYLSQIAANTQGSTRQRTSISKLKDIYIPFPSTKSEQIRIATALSNIDALISELGKLIEKKRAIKQGAMQQLITGKKRLKGFTEAWSKKKLGDVTIMNSGGTPSSKEPKYYNGSIKFLSISDMTFSGKFVKNVEKSITELGLSNSSARLFPAGTLMYAMYASLGKCSITQVETAISQAILGFVLSDKIDRDFLYYHFNFIEPIVKEMGQTGTQSNLSKTMVENFTILLPPIKEQRAIASVLSTMDEEISALEAKRDKYIAIKQGMMQQLLTGKIRLID